MEPQFWSERWARNEIGFHQSRINPLLPEFWPRFSAGIKQQDSVFVPLCGKTLDMLWLREQGYSITGVELSADAIRSFFQEHALPFETEASDGFEYFESEGYRLLAGDFFALKPEQLEQIQAVYDRAALIALPEAMQAEYVRHLLKLLPERPPIFLITLEYDPSEMNGPPFSTTERRVAELYGGAYRIEILSAREVLDENKGLKNRGLTQLTEKVYWLRQPSGMSFL